VTSVIDEADRLRAGLSEIILQNRHGALYATTVDIIGTRYAESHRLQRALYSISVLLWTVESERASIAGVGDYER
jgi:hypothetical protein